MHRENNLKITQLLSSRLCHDLISPVNAIRSGIELLETLSPEDDAEEIRDLMKQSTNNALNRLSLFRAAFGQGSLDTLKDSKSFQEFLCSNLPEDFRIQFDDGNQNFVASSLPRMITTLIILCFESCPGGGDIVLECSDGQSFKLSLAGRKIFFPNNLKAVLTTGGEDPLTPRDIIAFFAYSYCEEAGIKLELNINPSELEFKGSLSR